MRCYLVAILVWAVWGPFSTLTAATTASRWETSLVTLEITRKQFDYLQPWARQAQRLRKAGLVVEGRQILTTAFGLSDLTSVRLQRGGRGAWHDAKVQWIDYPANLALITTPDADFWDGLKPVSFLKNFSRESTLQVIRWQGGNLEIRDAEFNRFNVNSPNAGEAAHLMLEFNSEINGVGWAEPVVVGNRVAGLIFSQSGSLCRALPAEYVRTTLEAQRKGTFGGLGYFDFVWQPSENPDTLRYFGLTNVNRGVTIIEVQEKPGSPSLLRPRDVLLQVEDHEIDNEGDFFDPQYGHLMLETLAIRNKWAGDKVRLKIWREGRAFDLDYVLPRIQDAARLVPSAPFDQDPEYLIVGGLVFQPLTKNYLSTWGQNWERTAPFRLAYYRNEEPTADRPTLVVLSSVLPDMFNLGYENVRNLALNRVNGQRVSHLRELQQAIRQPQGGFHVFEFMEGDSLQRLVLDALELPTVTERVLERYGIEKAAHILPTDPEGS